MHRLRRIPKPDLGFAVHVPEEWVETAASPDTGGYEVARFWQRGEKAQNCLVFRHRLRSSLRSSVKGAQHVLEADDFQNFTLLETELAGAPAIRMDFVRPGGRRPSAKSRSLVGGPWTVRHYFVARGGFVYVLSFGTTSPESDRTVFDEMAARFELLDRRSAAA
jgi:hypothetical protein